MSASLLNNLHLYFGTTDLYEALGVDRDTDEDKIEDVIKKAYRKMSLKVHPDRAKPEDRENATKKFQALGAIYKILGDKNSRHLHKEGGKFDDDAEGGDEKIRIDIQPRNEGDREIHVRMFMSSHGTLRHYFPAALQFFFKSQTR